MQQLLVYRFGADAGFEGQLVGALERIEAGGSKRVLDVLFVGRDDDGELFAIDVPGGRAGGLVVPMVGFRLDVEERRRRTKRALRSTSAELINAVGEALTPGDAIIAVLMRDAPTGDLDDAVRRTGGQELVNNDVTATALSELAPVIVAAVG